MFFHLTVVFQLYYSSRIKAGKQQSSGRTKVKMEKSSKAIEQQ
jgi:hypothetical protein